MILVELGAFSATAVLPFGAEPADWTNPGPETAIVVYAEGADVCLRIGEPATVADFLLASGGYARLRLDAGDTLSAIAAAGASGAVRLTRCGDT